MAETYSTYEAKAKLSEILRKVRDGATVRISHRGETIAEVRPVAVAPAGIADRVDELARRGILTRAPAAREAMRPIAKRPGALARFLEDRDA